jgi:ribosomal protein S18 acetylase RimI-like enzyme
LAPNVVRARPQDHDAIVRVLVRAFDADPVANYLLRHDAHRVHAFELCFGAFLRHVTMPHGETWIADGGAGAALWTPPGRWDVGLRKTLAMGPSLLRSVGLSRARTMGAAANRVQRKHPSTPHFYLFAIGVDPDRQGRGIGGALLGAVLRRCDAERVPAYLEASTPNNRRLYERHGFRATEEVTMAPDAPPVWLMWREPSTESVAV